MQPLAAAMSSMLSTDSSNKASTSESGRPSRAHSELCLARARVLLGSYRTGQASDPAFYAAAIAAVLSDYPEDVVRYVTDPRTGVQNRIKFLPDVFEVREACE